MSGAARPATLPLTVRGTPRYTAIAAELTDWFDTHARDLPWRRVHPRTGRRDPYRSLVAEVMLQQTQVSRVLERFGLFLERFPSIRALARSKEGEVLAAWSGMGYYRRVLNLHAAAKMIVARHGGRVPADPEALADLPGIGRYTAGAIASMVFGVAAPAVDGNAERVILRIAGRDVEESERERSAWTFAFAERLVRATDRPGVLNESLMELGATVCTPANPACGKCPVGRLCGARRLGVERAIPLPRRRARRRDLFLASVVVVDARERLLVQRRNGSGLWAGMWQPLTVERTDRWPRPGELTREFGVGLLTRIGEFVHATTHRNARFRVWLGRLASGRLPAGAAWVRGESLDRLAMGEAQRRVIAMGLRARGGIALNPGIGPPRRSGSSRRGEWRRRPGRAKR